MAQAKLFGDDLMPAEKKALGLSEKQLAFRQKTYVPSQAEKAGIRAGDVIFGIDDKQLEMDVRAFLEYVRNNYVIGEKATINLLRDGKRMNLSMTFAR
jgi:S1-C subfamily serine protease